MFLVENYKKKKKEKVTGTNYSLRLGRASHHTLHSPPQPKLNQDRQGAWCRHASGLLPVGKTGELQEGPEGLALNAPLQWGPPWPAPHQQPGSRHGGLHMLLPAQSHTLCEAIPQLRAPSSGLPRLPCGDGPVDRRKCANSIYSSVEPGEHRSGERQAGRLLHALAKPGPCQ